MSYTIITLSLSKYVYMCAVGLCIQKNLKFHSILFLPSFSHFGLYFFMSTFPFFLFVCAWQGRGSVRHGFWNLPIARVLTQHWQHSSLVNGSNTDSASHWVTRSESQTTVGAVTAAAQITHHQFNKDCVFSVTNMGQFHIFRDSWQLYSADKGSGWHGKLMQEQKSA